VPVLFAPDETPGITGSYCYLHQIGHQEPLYSTLCIVIESLGLGGATLGSRLELGFFEEMASTMYFMLSSDFPACLS
jgi:hypothetical protein